MAQTAFLERYYEAVNRELGDPDASKRLTKAQKLTDFYGVESTMYEGLLSATGGESNIGRTEVLVDFLNGRNTYRFPENYRGFIALEKRDPAIPDAVLGRYRSIPEYHTGPGIVVLGPRKQFIIRPIPITDSTGEWMLIYYRLWGRIHYARCTIPTLRSLVSDLPDTANGAGTLERRDNYYRGVSIKVYGGTHGIPQENTVDGYAYDPSTGKGTFSVVHDWNPLPLGSPESPLMYEILPTIPEEHEQLYAVEVAIRNSPRRHNQQWMATIESTQKRLWGACLSHFQSAIRDRAPVLTLPLEESAVDPYANYF